MTWFQALMLTTFLYCCASPFSAELGLKADQIVGLSGFVVLVTGIGFKVRGGRKG